MHRTRHVYDQRTTLVSSGLECRSLGFCSKHLYPLSSISPAQKILSIERTNIWLYQGWRWRRYLEMKFSQNSSCCKAKSLLIWFHGFTWETTLGRYPHRVSSILPLWILLLNSSGHTRQQLSLPTEPSHYPLSNPGLSLGVRVIEMHQTQPRLLKSSDLDGRGQRLFLLTHTKVIRAITQLQSGRCQRKSLSLMLSFHLLLW